MHNYVDDDSQSRFPPAVVLGPGGVPRSWRIELLRYLDEAERSLYERYRVNEPWDSPANKKVLEQMPDAFRSPYEDPKSTNSGYYVLVGPGTVFDSTEGTRLRDITDGMSNTLLIVETKRNIPWTKPEDIPFDPDKPLPELGGFVEGSIAALMVDGSVHLFDNATIQDQLKWLIMRNDGHVVTWPQSR
jgi:hypothetical protein